jgi:hypothetical protein
MKKTAQETLAHDEPPTPGTGKVILIIVGLCLAVFLTGIVYLSPPLQLTEF